MELKGLVQVLNRTPIVQILPREYYSSIQQCLQQGTFAYRLLTQGIISKLYHGAEDDDKEEEADPGRCKDRGDRGADGQG